MFPNLLESCHIFQSNHNCCTSLPLPFSFSTFPVYQLCTIILRCMFVILSNKLTIVNTSNDYFSVCMSVLGPLKCGAKVEGTVLFIDFLNQCVELTLCHGIMQRINTVQGRFTVMTLLPSSIDSFISEEFFAMKDTAFCCIFLSSVLLVLHPVVPSYSFFPILTH